ncbi:MAG TPA: VIT1/CCC1 transporter family protein [Ignavibacteria bacterium]|nr:VIT1/CCC1 transporter family protein [Ignavibacteria bacterium]
MKNIIEKETIDIWKHHLQDEADAAYLYKILGNIEKNENKSSIYLQLAEVEEKHKQVWLELFLKNNIKSDDISISPKAKFYGWYAKKFGTGLISKLMMREEGLEVKPYLGLYNQSSSVQTKDIALQLAKDSAEHSGKLTTLLESEGESWHQIESGGLMRNVIYGFNDGLTANFGLIAGVIGASVQPHIILLTGISGMFADALSMGSSGYLAAVSQGEVYDHEKKMEAEEIRLMPELEAEELSLVYQAKGMNKADAQQLANEIIKNPELALKESVREELGISESTTSPFREAWITGLATAIGALIPVAPFFFLDGTFAVWTSFIVSMIAHFIVGAARSVFTGRGIFRSGLDMFIVGIGIAVIGYFIGELISRYL